MLKLAAHLEMNFSKETSFRDRWQAVHNLDFKGCEFVWRSRDLAEASELQQHSPLNVSVLGGTTGGKPGGDRPALVWPGDRERLAIDVEKAVGYAKQLSCPRLIMVIGNLIEGWSVEQLRQAAVDSLKSIAPILEQAGITVVLEPLNSKVDHKGVYCNNSTEACKIIEAVGSSHVKMLYDVYHMQIMEGDIIRTIREKHDYIGYYHLAMVPGRYEPIGGELNFPAILEAIAATGYNDFVGLEYRPSREPIAVLEELKATYPDLI